MTYNEIIVALECCNEKKGESCELKCPIFCLTNCSDDLHEAALDLIERQKAEIERLSKPQGVTFLANGIEIHAKGSGEYYKFKRLVKSEAITEFAEMLKTTFKQMEYTANVKRKTVTVDELICQTNWIIREALIDVIDELLSEMTEGNNGT